MGTTTERLLFIGFMAAFVIKAPLWPFHTWLPDAAASATPSTSVLMVSVVDKIGTFGMLRWCLEVFPGASEWASPVVIGLAVVSILYGALLAIGQDDLRRLIAFTSVSHFGFIILGIFVFTSTSTAGATLYMFNHGMSTAALFLVTGIMIARRGSASIGDFGGVQKIAPIMSGVLLVAGLSSLSLPGLAPFISEFMVLAGTFTRSPVAAVLATLGIVLAALYILIMYQRTMTGPLRDGNEGVHDLNPREVAALAPAIVLIVGLGFYPQPVLNVINPAVDEVVSQVGDGDPAPISEAVTCRPRPGGWPLMFLADLPPIDGPTVEYALIAPILIITGVAVIGTVIEAAVPRRRRFEIQALVAVVGVVAALVDTVVVYQSLDKIDERSDRPRPDLHRGSTLGRWSGRLHVGPAARVRADELPAVRRASPRGWAQRVHRTRRRRARVGGGGRGPGGQHRAHRGVPARDVRAARDDGVRHVQRPADDVRRARGAVAAAVPDVRPGAPTPPAQPGGGAQVLPARRVLVGLLRVRHRPDLRLRRQRPSSPRSTPPSRLAPAARTCCSRRSP